jgi:hypothetical protein
MMKSSTPVSSSLTFADSPAPVISRVVGSSTAAATLREERGKP